MPGLHALRSEVLEKRDDVLFLCVNVRDEPDVIRDYWKKNGFGMRPVRLPQESVGALFGVNNYSTGLLLDPDGVVTFRSVGGDLKGLRKALLGG